MIFLLHKRASWILLISLFVFDNLVSFYAVTRLGGREANLAIAPLVEKHPWLYFLCIPATVLVVALIVGAIKKAASMFLKKRISENILERIILGALAIYWAISNSSLNLTFLLGHRQPISVWVVTFSVGVVLALAYALFFLLVVNRGKITEL